MGARTKASAYSGTGLGTARRSEKGVPAERATSLNIRNPDQFRIGKPFFWAPCRILFAGSLNGYRHDGSAGLFWKLFVIRMTSLTYFNAAHKFCGKIQVSGAIEHLGSGHAVGLRFAFSE